MCAVWLVGYLVEEIYEQGKQEQACEHSQDDDPHWDKEQAVLFVPRQRRHHLRSKPASTLLVFAHTHKQLASMFNKVNNQVNMCQTSLLF